mmetsp:Transcript_20080/g.35703  ORF Transcript_20080/g.35703 Transcript_20080/m.35703 type:complete len:336 (-) Transcript_20080:46-1053(-)
MLNSQEEFSGGGTFFENQLRPMLVQGDSNNNAQPLKPSGPGHAIAHFSSDRHSGAATFSGVRDILVIFLAATEKKTQSSINTRQRKKAPRWEYNARIKSTARTYCSECSDNIHDQLICRILHHRIAIDQVFDDGEAWHYLGMALLDYHGHLQLSVDSVTDADGNGITHIQTESDDSNYSLSQYEPSLELAVSCLDEATKHTPCDGRLYNNLGIALERLLEYNIANSLQSKKVMELHDKIRSAYRNSIMIHSVCEQLGCDVAADYESACLNYGLYLSKRDQFDNAIDVLSRIVPPTTNTAAVNENQLDAATWARRRVIRDATNLLGFCSRQRDIST